MSSLAQKIKEEITLEKVLYGAIKLPGVKIKRDAFLRKELIKYCPEETIKVAIQYNPAKAGIPKSLIYKLSNSVISYETKKVSGLSVLASLPSSINAMAAVGSASTDITSYFAHIIRVVQELAYLYGFPEFELSEDNIDCIRRNPVAAFAAVSGHGAERVAGVLGV